MFAPHKAKTRKFLPWDGPYIMLEKTYDIHYKISKTGISNKEQTVLNNRLKLVKEEADQRRVLSRSATGRRQSTSDVYDMEETAEQGIFSENPKRTIVPRKIQMDGGRR